MRRTRLHLSPETPEEWALTLCPIAVAIAAMIILGIPLIDRLVTNSIGDILDVVCSVPLPTFWCRVPRPVPWIAAIQLFAYAGFLVASFYIVYWVRFGDYRKPSRYVPGSARDYHVLGYFLWWLFLVAGGQVLPQARFSAFSLFGLVAFSMPALCLGLASIRALAVVYRFRKHAAAPPDS
jgi:hypothetical protein